MKKKRPCRPEMKSIKIVSNGFICNLSMFDTDISFTFDHFLRIICISTYIYVAKNTLNTDILDTILNIIPIRLDGRANTQFIDINYLQSTNFALLTKHNLRGLKLLIQFMTTKLPLDGVEAAEIQVFLQHIKECVPQHSFDIEGIPYEIITEELLLDEHYASVMTLINFFTSSPTINAIKWDNK